MADPLDRAALDELREMAGDDPGLYAELLDTFLADADLYLAELHAASDAPALVRPAHSLKSNAMNVGAAALAELCRALEADARADAVADPAARVAAIGAELDVVRPAVLAERPSS
jgi:HPt (histidine-containing phosphotransfer) domain-containing protein